MRKSQQLHQVKRNQTKLRLLNKQKNCYRTKG